MSLMSVAWRIGDGVQVYSFGKWYEGTIVSLGRTRIKVGYRTGRRDRVKDFPLSHVVASGTYPTAKMGMPRPEDA